MIHTAAQPSHDWAASDPRPTSPSTPTERSICSRRTKSRSRRDVRQHVDQQGLWRPAEPAAVDRTRDAWSCPRTTGGTKASTRRCRSTPARTRFRGIQGGGRPAHAGVRALLRMPTVCFRGGCLTGPNHAGAQLHGFLSYLMRCTTGDPYTVFGYKGKQVRDNLHSADLVAASRLSRGPACRRGLQPRRRAIQQLLDARGDRAVRGDRRKPARLHGVRSRRGSAITAGGSGISSVQRDYPTGQCVRRAAVPREIHDANRGAL